MMKIHKMITMTIILLFIFFMNPLQTNTKSFYKIRRKSNNVLRERHLGTDFEITNELSISLRNRCIVALNDGFVVFYRHFITNDLLSKLYGKKMSNTGGVLKQEFLVMDTGHVPYTGLFSNNNFILIYQVYYGLTVESKTSWSIKGKIYNSELEEVKGEFQIGSPGLRRNAHVCVLTSGGFVVSYLYNPSGTIISIKAVIYNRNGLIIKDEFEAISSSNAAQRLAALTTGGFVLTWTGTDKKVHSQIYNENGEVLFSNFFMSNTYVCTMVEVIGLTNGDFVIAWSGSTTNPTAQCDIYQVIFSNSGTSKLSETKVNSITINEQTEAFLAALPKYNWYLITWISKETGANNKIYSKKYFNNGEPVYKDQIQVNSDEAIIKEQTQTAILPTTGNFVVTWTEGDWSSNGNNPVDIYGNIVINKNPTCQDFNKIIPSGEISSIDFSSNVIDEEEMTTSLRIIIKTQPSSGLMTSSVTNQDVGSLPFGLNELRYTNSVPGKYSFTYVSVDIMNAESTSCTVNLVVCYVTCSTCSEAGDSLNNKCSTCKTGYYSKSDAPGNCYKNAPEFYYLSSSLNKFLPCFKNCVSCSSDGDDTKNNCMTCKTGYRLKSDEATGNCYNTLPFNYYLNNVNNTYVPCSNIDSLDKKTETMNIIFFYQSTKEALQPISFKIKLSKNFYDEFLSRKINEAYVLNTDATNSNSKINFNIDNFVCDELTIHNDGGLNGGSYIVNLIDGVGNLIKSTNNFYINNKIEPVLNTTIDSKNNSTTSTTNNNTTTSNSTFSILEYLNTNTTTQEIPKIISFIIKTKNYTSATIKDPIVYKTNTTTIQIASTTNESLALEKNYSIENLLSLITFDECEKVLKSNYNIPDEEKLIYSKIDYNPNVENDKNLINNSGLSIFDGKGNPLNLSLCENVTIIYQFPTSLNLTKAKDIASLGYDIYNPEDKLYNDFCVSFSNNDSDFTVNNRRKEIFPNVTIDCSDGCTYSGMDYEINYVNCDCKGNTTETEMNYLEEALNDLTQSNFIVITCLPKVYQGDIFSNYGFIMVLCTFVASILISIAVGFFYVILKPENLNNIVKFDAEFYEPGEEKTEVERNKEINEENKNSKEDTLNNEINQREELNLNADVAPHVGNTSFKNNFDYLNKNLAYLNNFEIKESQAEYVLTSINSTIKNENENKVYSSTRHLNNFISNMDNENHNKIFYTQQNKHEIYESSKLKTQEEKVDEIIKKLKRGNKINDNLSRSKIYLSVNNLSNLKSKYENEEFLKRKKQSAFFYKNKNKDLNSLEDQRFPYNIYFNSRKKQNSENNTHDNYLSNKKSLNDKNLKISYSLRDFKNMKFAQIMKHDKRTFWYAYWDSLVEKHILISLIVKKTLLTPYPIRIFKFFFAICLDFTMNAIFYSDGYISNRHTTTETKDFFYTFIHELPKSLWATLISAIISSLLEKIIEPSKKIEKELNNSLVTKDLEQIKLG